MRKVLSKRAVAWVPAGLVALSLLLGSTAAGAQAAGPPVTVPGPSQPPAKKHCSWWQFWC